MSIFKQPPLQRGRHSQAIDPIVTRVDPFLRTALAKLDPRIMTIPEKRLAYVHFAFGAITELSVEPDLDETQCLAALVVCLQRTPGFSPQDVSYLVGRCMTSADDAKSRQARVAGAQAVRAWGGEHPAEASLRLFALLTP